MIKFKNILNEGLSGTDYSITPAYVKIFKVLFKNNIKGEEVLKSSNFIQQKIGLSLEESAKIAILYKFNYKSNGDFDGVKDSQWVIPSEESLSIFQRAAGDYFNITPFVFKSFSNNSNSQFYQPVVNIEVSRRNNSNVDTVRVLFASNVYDIAYNKVKRILRDEGYGYFESDFLERVAMYNAEESAKEEWDNYLNKKESLKLATKEEMIELIHLEEEYEDLKYYVEDYVKDIEELKKEKQVLSHKVNKLNKEIHLLSMEIEKLTDTVDYGDDEEEYYSMYEEEVSELNDRMNEYESIREELLNQIDDIETKVYEVDDELESYYEDYQWYTDDKKFKELYIEKRTELIFQEMEEYPLAYVLDSEIYLDDALNEGIIYLNEEDESDQFGFEDEHFYIFISY
jgi:predicted  nucleic acid-binding Zn-ribbon protein